MAMNSGPLVLGIDAGTSSLRAALFDLAGTPVAASDVPYEVNYPKPGWAEQHPDEWWMAMVRAVRECISAAAVTPARIVGLAVDSPCNVVLARHDGTPLMESIIWMDLRASEQARLITGTHDPVLRYCGGDVPAEWPLPKALWLRQHLPESWDQATYVIDEMSWLTHKLTGNWVAGL
ncbi:MAG TPA: FGGY family carbohydrate kinase, partial [Ktedonobacterales bacterium]|nr:FGGY family carbohydrate kinase [Ktedonobacterales bacterium]